MQKGKIYLIPTLLSPDTMDKVITPYSKQVMKGLNNLFVENIRTARRFISSLKLEIVIDELSFFELTKDTSEDEILKYFKKIPEGSDIGILSEAGCPGIADPGALAVKVAHSLERQVVPLSGPSSIFMSLMASGFNGQSFAFHGYLPIDKNERHKRIRFLEQESSHKKQTQIFIETPYRNNTLFEDLKNICNGETSLCISSELTSENEFIKSAKINQWKNSSYDFHKKPVVFILYAG